MKILIVDDEPEITEMLCKYMSLKNNECTIKNTGKEGLEALKNDSFDAMILDLAMPEMNGYQVLDELKKQDKVESSNILVLTALNLGYEEEDKLESYGVKKILKKPIAMQDLYSKIEEITT